MFGFILLSYNTLYHLRDWLYGVKCFALSECILFLLFTVYSDERATAPTRQYNLRSNGRKTMQLPAELHMAEDSTFLKDLLASQKTPLSGQVPDSDSSLNASDCEALIATSGDEHDSCIEGTNQETFVKKTDQTVSDTQSTSQQAINIQILAQLQSLGSRLDAMEKKSCKKVTTPPRLKQGRQT